MIDRKTAIKELNEKICFVSEKYVDSDIPVKDAIADENCDFMATEGEIIALLKTEPASDICREIKILRRRLDHDKLCELNTSGTLSANLEGKLQMLDEIQKVIDEICDNPPEEIPRYKIAEAEKFLENVTDPNETKSILREIIMILFGKELYLNRPENINVIIDAMDTEKTSNG